MKVLITIYVTFYKDNKDNKDTEYDQLPIPVKNEVNEIFNNVNSEFYTYALPYSLNDITHYPKGSKYNLFPSYDIVPEKILIDLPYILIYGKIQYSNEHYLRQNNQGYYPVTYKDFLFNIKEGFHKATHDGSLVSRYGKYIGEEDNRYLILFDADNVNLMLL